jgi:hypothetical protein
MESELKKQERTVEKYDHHPQLDYYLLLFMVFIIDLFRTISYGNIGYS